MHVEDERRQLDHALRDLVGEFEGALPARVVRAEFDQALAQFADARVRTFLPVLVARASRTDLRRRLTARGRLAAPPCSAEDGRVRGGGGR